MVEQLLQVLSAGSPWFWLTSVHGSCKSACLDGRPAARTSGLNV